MITDYTYKKLPNELKAEAILFAVSKGYTRDEATNNRKPLQYTVEYGKGKTEIIKVQPIK